VRILTINCGSATLKFELFEAADGERSIARGVVDKVDGHGSVELNRGSGKSTVRSIAAADHGEATLQAVCLLDSSALLGGLKAVGHRVVDGGCALLQIGAPGRRGRGPFDMVVLNSMSRYHLAAEALRRAGKTPGSRPDLDLRVRGGDRKGHRLLEGALRGPARDKQLDLDTMHPPTETLMMGLLKDQDREGAGGTNNGA
jgi:Acetokinase family